MDSMTQELAKALDLLLSTVMHPQEFTASEADHRTWVAMKALRKYHDAQEAEKEGQRATPAYILPLAVDTLEDVARTLDNFTSPGMTPSEKARYSVSQVALVVRWLKMLQKNV